MNPTKNTLIMLWCGIGILILASPVIAAADVPASPAAATAAPRLEFFGLLPGRSTKTDVDLLLGDPAPGPEGRLIYSPPDQAMDAEHVEAVYIKGSRTLLLLEVVLKQPMPYGDMAAAAGQRVLVDKRDDGWVWEYRTPTFLALGYRATQEGPPQTIERMRYASPQFVADLFIARGDKADNENRADDALTEYEKASRIDPRHAVPLLKIGKLHKKSGAKDQALLYFTAATKAEYPPRGRAEAYYLIGKYNHDDNKPDLAQKAYTQAIAEDPTYATAHFWLGRLYRTLIKQPREAIAAFEKTIALKPEGSLTYYAYYNIGAVQEEQGNAKTAAAAFQKALETDPADPVDSHVPKASVRLAWNLLSTGEFAAAEQACRRRLDQDQGDATAMVYLAMAISSQAQQRLALVGLFTDDPRQKESLEWLDKAITAGYADKATLETSPYLKQVREQSALSFSRLLSKMQKQ